MAVLVLRKHYLDSIAMDNLLTTARLAQLIVLAVHYVIIFFGIPETRQSESA